MSTADLPGAGSRGMTWPQQLSLAFGVIYTLIGVIGFFITGFGDFFGNMNGSSMTHDDTLLGFMINPAHNVVHILIGLAGIALSRTLKSARTYGLLLLVGYGAAFVYGVIAVGKDWDFLNLNWADNILHIVTAIVGAVIAFGPVKTITQERGRNASLR
ncbi:DUF4383 domain-containing protein [Modestobacter sp. L9-4]|jgi:hypothetical protein|uniref:DUF4383 domain-containing protein n=1 Tax=Modestobacter sp. L9-4 TaxID=2851567 RepID=UPI001C77AB51|nr:DUF4383 domain-containing protein [Modestobacter sp. L9-4]QXG77755.1 DUF4383 domain-containing protein [Modestobacter sp. L9-4]